MTDVFARLQHWLPKHLITRAVGRLARSRIPPIRAPFIRAFASAYEVDLSEAELPLDAYTSFNAFFTRALKPGARPIDPDPQTLVSPADGSISQCGVMEHGTLLQAKGTRYALPALAGSLARDFEGGSFATIYLAPRDYHRVHAPADLRLVATETIPGTLFSVNARTEAAVSDLFCRNERLACRLRSPHGDVLLVMVGALIVGAIETVWGATPCPYREQRTFAHGIDGLEFSKGAEFGRFLLGSTVILCFEHGSVTLDDRLGPGARVRMGEPLARWA